MKIQDSSFNGLKVTVGTKSVTHAPTHPLTDAPKAICHINFFKVGGITTCQRFRLFYYIFVAKKYFCNVCEYRICQW